MLVDEHTPRVVAGLRKLRPELTPAPSQPPQTPSLDPELRITGMLRQYYGTIAGAAQAGEWRWVRAAVRGGCLMAWREGTLPLRAAARLPLRHLHLRAAHPRLPHAFQLSRVRDDATVATFQACNEVEYSRWVRALCVEILRQTPLPYVRFLDVLPAADTGVHPVTRARSAGRAETPSTPIPPPRARRRLLSSTKLDTRTTLRDHSPAATDEGIVIVDEDYEDSSSDRSLDLSIELRTTIDQVDGHSTDVQRTLIKCDNCVKLNADTSVYTPLDSPQHHTLPRADYQGRHRYLKRWEVPGNNFGGAERGRSAVELARRKAASLEFRARSCSPNAHEATTQYVPVKERRALFESLSKGNCALARSSEQLTTRVSIEGTAVESRKEPTTPRRAASMHDLQTSKIPGRSVSDLRQFFEAVARGAGGSEGCATLQRRSAPPHTQQAYSSLSCA